MLRAPSAHRAKSFVTLLEQYLARLFGSAARQTDRHAVSERVSIPIEAELACLWVGVVMIDLSSVTGR